MAQIIVMTEEQQEAYGQFDKALKSIAAAFEVNFDGLQYAMYATLKDAIDDTKTAMEA